MSDELQKRRLETEAIVVGYAMSRLDKRYLLERNLTRWNDAYSQAASALSEVPASFKNLRDEFDPIHPNSRAGWHRRPTRPSRLKVAADLCDLSDEALLELVNRILSRDNEATEAAIDSLTDSERIANTVAERLLTGRRAEEFFLDNCKQIVNVERPEIEDLRLSARGFDFGVTRRPEVAIEVKGLKQTRGEILFTDREWTEARFRGDMYWLVIIGNLVSEPVPFFLRDPHSHLAVRSTLQKQITASWRSTIDFASFMR